MKTTVLILLTPLSLSVSRAQDPSPEFTANLQQALYAEEIDNDLPTAIAAYQAVIDRYDADRKIAATALFRLAECHRKSGDDETATTLYNRLLRDFSDQTQLTELAVTHLGPGASPSSTSPLDTESRIIEQLQTEFTDAPDRINARSADGLAPLEKYAAAGQEKVVGHLIDMGAKPDQTAALHHAVLAGHKSVVARLLDAGADPSRRATIELPDGGTRTVTPLHVAATTGNIAITELLLDRGASIDANAGLPLGAGHGGGFNSRRTGPPDTAQAGPINSESVSGTTALHIAVARRYSSLTGLLLSRGADTSHTNQHGQGAAHLAVRAREPVLVHQLIDAGAPIDLPDAAGYTPFLIAANNNEIELANLLLEAGADHSRATPDHMNAAYFAVVNDNLPFLKWLIARGIDLDIAPDNDHPLIHQAIGNDSSFLATLLEAGADPDRHHPQSAYALHRAAEFDNAPAIHLLAGAGATIDARFDDQTPLMAAAGINNLAATKALLEAGADANARNQNGSTPLTFLATVNDPKESSVAIATALLDAGAYVNATDSSSFAALHYAASRNNAPLTAFLISAGADPLLRTINDMWPLELAKDSATKAALFAPTRNRAIDLENQIFSCVPEDHAWRIPQTRAREGFDPYTLFELLHVVRDAAFTSATIVRLDPGTRQVASQQEINLSEALAKSDASADVQLQWGDIVEYRRRTGFEPGLTQQQANFLTAYMTRDVTLEIAEDGPVGAKAIPAVWTIGPDSKSLVPDFDQSFDPETSELFGTLTLSDAIENIGKHYNRTTGPLISLTRKLPLPDGTLRPTKIANDLDGNTLSAYDTLTPIRDGDSLLITLSDTRLPAAMPRVGSPTRSSGRRVVLPPKNR